RLADDDGSQADRAPLLLHDARVLRRRRDRGPADADAALAAEREGALAGDLQPDDDDARADDDLPLRHPDGDRGLRTLPRPADDRRARHGVPAPERAQLLA